jgi:predicted GNAT family N-acyltransferase
MALVIEPFSPAHDRSSFLCEKTSLNDYLHKQMKQDVRRGIAQAYVLIDEPSLDILGYYTLSSSLIEISDIDENLKKKLPRHPLPCQLIGRLARHKDLNAKGYGKFLLLDSLQKILEISNKTGVYAAVVDALDQDVVSFYQKFGFRILQSSSMKLYLPKSDISSVLLKSKN